MNAIELAAKTPIPVGDFLTDCRCHFCVKAAGPRGKSAAHCPSVESGSNEIDLARPLPTYSTVLETD